MNLEKLKPWNWFKHEEAPNQGGNIPVQRETSELPGYVPAQSYTPATQLHREIDRLFDEAVRGFGLPGLRSNFWPGDASSTISQNLFRPSLNVSSDNDSYQVSLEAPGLKQADLSIELHDDVLTIKGHKSEEQESKDKHFYRIERQYGTFQRTLSLPEDSIAEEIQANMKDGVLHIRIPRRETSDSNVKTIPIS